jgi:hypothetical protein
MDQISGTNDCYGSHKEWQHAIAYHLVRVIITTRIMEFAYINIEENVSSFLTILKVMKKVIIL